MSKQWKYDLKALYQQTRKELPPPELDQKIRAAAQKAVQRKSPNLKWYLSSAAVVLLAVNVVLFTYVPEPEVIEIPRQTASAPHYKVLPKPSAPSNSVPMMEPVLDSIDAEKAGEKEISARREVLENKSYSKKIMSEEGGVSNDSLQTQTEEAAQPIELNESFNSVKQRYEIRYPKYLPFDVHRLIAGRQALTGHQSGDSLEIKQNNKLILKMSRVQQGVFIEAYPEAKIWGVDAEWGQSTTGLTNCVEGDYLVCDLNTEVQGGFENNRLIFIRWLQKNER